MRLRVGFRLYGGSYRVCVRTTHRPGRCRSYSGPLGPNSKSLIANMLQPRPTSLMLDLYNCATSHSKYPCQSSLGIRFLAYIKDLFSIKNSAAALLAPWLGSVPHLILTVCNWVVPPKIAKTIIRWIPIPVTGFHLHWTRANKGFKNKPVNLPFHLFIDSNSQSDLRISPHIYPKSKNMGDTGDIWRVTIPVGSHPSLIRNFISRVSGARFPNFVDRGVRWGKTVFRHIISQLVILLNEALHHNATSRCLIYAFGEESQPV